MNLHKHTRRPGPDIPDYVLDFFSKLSREATRASTERLAWAEGGYRARLYANGRIKIAKVIDWQTEPTTFKEEQIIWDGPLP